MIHFIAKVVVRVCDRLRRVYNRIYVCYLRGEFKSLGRNASIDTTSVFMNPQLMSIGDGLIAREGVKLRAYTSYGDAVFTPEITIGNHVHLAADATINIFVRLVVGDYSGIGQGSRVMDHMHGLPDYSDVEIPVMEREITSRGGVIIGRNVMVGSGVIIMAGVEIGDNAFIGANSVVTKSVPANCVAVGAPAKVIKVLDGGMVGGEVGAAAGVRGGIVR